MVRIACALIAGSLSACLLFACGDKGAVSYYTGGTTATGVGGTNDTGGSTGTGGSTDIGGLGGSGVGLGGVTGGSGGASGGTTSATVSYVSTIAPLMKASCATSGCHAGSSAQAGIALDTYANVKANATLANDAIQGGSMPLGSPLSAAQKKSFQDWVTAGEPNN
jgi:hypothetical protein